MRSFLLNLYSGVSLLGLPTFSLKTLNRIHWMFDPNFRSKHHINNLIRRSFLNLKIYRHMVLVKQSSQCESARIQIWCHSNISGDVYYFDFDSFAYFWMPTLSVIFSKILICWFKYWEETSYVKCWYHLHSRKWIRIYLKFQSSLNINELTVILFCVRIQGVATTVELI